MGIGEAVNAMKDGKKVALAGSDCFLTIIGGDGKSSPWIGIQTAGSDPLPWLPSHADLLADNYYVVL